MSDTKKKYITFAGSQVDYLAQDRNEISLLRDELFELITNLPDYRSPEKIKYYIFELGASIIFSMMLHGDNLKQASIICSEKLELINEIFNINLKSAPSYDTMLRFLRKTDINKLEESYRKIMSGINNRRNEDSLIKSLAMDGKMFCSTCKESEYTTKKKNPIICVTLIDTSTGCILGEEYCQKKIGEKLAIKSLINRMELDNSIVSIDAIASDNNLCSLLDSKNIGFLIQVKDNWKSVRKGLQEAFKYPNSIKPRVKDCAYSEEINNTHSRSELRECMIIRNRFALGLKSFDVPYIKTLVYLRNTVNIYKRETIQEHYYISNRELTAKETLILCRKHWKIETLHASLDLNFREDHSRLKNNSLKTYNLLCKIIIQFLKNKETKFTFNNLRLKMCFDDNLVKKIFSYNSLIYSG